MTEYLTEQEQIQQLKNWIKQYGLTVLAGVIIALMISAGWRYWQSYRNKILTHASVIYDEMLALRGQNNVDGANSQAKKLLSDFANTPYAQMAAFTLARDALLKKNDAEAITQLRWVLDHGNEDSMRAIARMRLARIYVAENKPDAALDVLKKVEDKSFAGLANEIRGDAYLAQKNLDSARNAYHLALAGIPNAEINRPILQMKYDNLKIS